MDATTSGGRAVSRVTSQLRKNHKVWNSVYKKWTKPFLTCFSDKDPITRGGEKDFIENVPGVKGVKQLKVENAGHFLQEDKGHELATRLIEFIKTSN